jgi:hypothetical protein
MDNDNDDNGNSIDIEKIKQELLADDEQACLYQNIVNNRELDSSIQDKDYAEFVINVLKKQSSKKIPL